MKDIRTAFQATGTLKCFSIRFLFKENPGR